MKKLFAIFIFFLSMFLQADEANQSVRIENNITTRDLNVSSAVVQAKNRLKAIDESVKSNIWLVQFSNYEKYINLQKEYEETENALKKAKNEDLKLELNNKLRTISEQLELLKDYSTMPLNRILEAKNLGEYEKISTLFGILSGVSDIKNLRSRKSEYSENLNSLFTLINRFEEKRDLLNLLIKNYPDDENLKEQLKDANLKISEFISAREIGRTTFDVYSKRIDERINNISSDITAQVKRAINIAAIIVIIVLISLLLKYIAKKSIKDDEGIYMTNKVINFLNITLIVIIIFFAYIENATYLATVLGFASAGIAIAMKDMFMSMLGWLVITIGGSFHVGDRIRVKKLNGELYVGDIVDISLLRMTIYEDITYSTYIESRRAGRIIFVPNNYIFTELISNYTHNGMKTVWDGIDILLTFDSNHQKATHLIQNIARKYSKGYTEMAKKGMNKLRSQYSIKNSSMEPRIYQFFEPYGIKISVWYMTSSYATLNLRSNISSEILDALKNETDITIAYPKQTLYIKQEDFKSGDVLVEKTIKDEESSNEEQDI